MEEMLRELEKKLDWPPIVECTLIPKGFSFDEKYKIELENKETYFIKMCDVSTSERKYEEYEYMKHFESIGVPVPKTVHFIKLATVNKCVQVYEWIEGIDGEDILHELTIKEQYKAGKKAGEVLKKIHTLRKDNMEESWETYRWNKYERYLQLLMEYDVDFIDLKSVLNFVENHKSLLQDRPRVFLHDDFHPANIMIHQNKFHSVVDFARFDFGDPIHDFYKTALFTVDISIPFAVGQVHGYCDGEPSLHFWKLYSLYAAMIFPADIVWANRITPNLLDGMKMRLRRILEEHNGFTSYIPSWYKSFNKDIINIE
ncbi:aminoglycoside phosphotransferase family protein [Bacillus gaemokensis]|uniref:Aminoglycoside phosphotransferase n=1 Tax=Bacillus gaemokensis TaxID=574375 RepID=A0A073KJN6_9BACI|nr:aminoglycoside phosphotransferase family protein [Bacillus gaemokensis]KEK22533.1 aminoglycoside phosphotransferase [Bacillus gaemokensis]KYG34624.1 aminoglycoside phosphotransferase [Bacillus gaemokensis]